MHRHARAAKATAVFFGVMLLLTFCSRTIYRSMMPSVRTEYPSGGTLKLSVAASQFAIEADRTEFSYIPATLPGGLRIADLYVKSGSRIQACDPVLAFYVPEAEALLLRSETELRKMYLQQEERTAEIAGERERIKRQMAETPAGAEAELLVGKLRLLEEGYYNGTLNEETENELTAMRETVSILRELRDSGWVYTAGRAGTVCEIYVSAGETYAGTGPILRYVPETEQVYITALPETEGSPVNAEWSANVRLVTDTGSISAENAEIRGRKLVVPVSDDVDPAAVNCLEAEFTSPYRPMLIPNEALHGQYVYTLEKQTGEWGQTVYTVKARRVYTGASDGVRTEVLSGLNVNDAVIVSCTEELTDGKRVLPEGYE